EFIPLLGDSDPFIVSAALTALGRPGNTSMLASALRPTGTDRRPPVLGLLLALRRSGDREADKLLAEMLLDEDPAIRRVAIQWIGEERLTLLAERLDAAGTRPPVTRELFEAWLAARELLDGKYDRTVSRDFAGEEYVAAILKDAKRPTQLRALALRMLRPDHPLFSKSLLTDLFETGDVELCNAIVRIWMLRSDIRSQVILRAIALDETKAMNLRALAVVGLGRFSDDKETREALERVMAHPELRGDAERSLGRYAAGPKRTAEEWRKSLASAAGDAKAG